MKLKKNWIHAEVDKCRWRRIKSQAVTREQQEAARVNYPTLFFAVNVKIIQIKIVIEISGSLSDAPNLAGD